MLPGMGEGFRPPEHRFAGAERHVPHTSKNRHPTPSRRMSFIDAELGFRAAILKAYYTKLAESTSREHPDIPEEVLQVSLNPDATNIPYLLGRLFSVLEAVQAAANPGSTSSSAARQTRSCGPMPASFSSGGAR